MLFHIQEKVSPTCPLCQKFHATLAGVSWSGQLHGLQGPAHREQVARTHDPPSWGHSGAGQGGSLGAAFVGGLWLQVLWSPLVPFGPH